MIFSDSSRTEQTAEEKEWLRFPVNLIIGRLLHLQARTINSDFLHKKFPHRTIWFTTNGTKNRSACFSILTPFRSQYTRCSHSFKIIFEAASRIGCWVACKISRSDKEESRSESPHASFLWQGIVLHIQLNDCQWQVLTLNIRIELHRWKIATTTPSTQTSQVLL